MKLRKRKDQLRMRKMMEMAKTGRVKMKMGLAFVMTLALMVSMIMTAMPISAMAAGASTGITLGTGKIAKGNKIWFGSYNGSPILWRVLGNGTGDTAGSGMLLISDNILAGTRFKPDVSTGNQWQGSSAQVWCTNFYSNWPNKIEQNAILATIVTESENYTSTQFENHGGYTYGPASLKGEHFFFLSAQEADTLFSGDDNRKASGANYIYWWLRSPYANDKAGVVFNNGWICYEDMTWTNGNGARPAFNLNLSSVFLTSEISSESSTSYKLTMKDENLSISVTSGKRASWEGNVVTIPYTISGTNKTTAKAYVMVTNKAYTESSASVLQYTALTAGTESGTGMFTLDSGITGTWGRDYHVYLMAVNESGDKKTDYASTPVDLHTHDFTYTVGTGDQANTITATCGNAGCHINTGLTMTISAPEHLTYDGQPKAATLNTDYNTTAFPDTYTISYEGTGNTVYEKSTTAPTNAGDYKATVTVGTATAEVSFTIAPASVTLTANSRDTDVFDGTEKTVTGFTSSVAGLTFANTVTASGSGTNAGKYDVTFSGVTLNTTRDTTGNYVVTGTTNGTLTITQAHASGLTVTLKGSSHTYDGNPKAITNTPSSNATGGTTTFTYSFEEGGTYVTDLSSLTKTEAGTYTVYVKATNPNYSNTAETMATLTINKTVPAATAPTAKTLTYTGTEQELVNAGSTNDGTMYYAVTNELKAPTDESAYTTSIPTAINAGTYYVWYKVVGDGNHNDSASAPVGVTINPAGITLTAKSGTKTYDGTDKEVTGFTSSVAGLIFAESVSANGHGANAGKYDVTFSGVAVNMTRDTTGNYVVTGTTNGKLTINKAANPVTVTSSASVKIGGNTVDLSRNLIRAEGAVTYAITGVLDGCAIDAKTGVLTSGTKTGACTVTVTAAGNGNYEAGTAAITVTVTEKDTQTISFAEQVVTKTWGDTEFINPLSGAKTKVTYTVTGGTNVASVAADGTATIFKAGTVTILKAGTATVTAAAEETNSIAGASASYKLIVNKAVPVISAPKPVEGLVYTGSAQKLVKAGSAEGGMIQYALGTKTKAKEEDFSTSIPTGTEAGIYYVWYKAIGDKNHKDTAPVCVTVTVGKKEQEAPEVSHTAAASQTASDGTLTITDDSKAWEYSVNGGSWNLMPAGTNEVSDLAAGIYRVRYQEQANYLPGEAAEVSLGYNLTGTVTWVYSYTDRKSGEAAVVLENQRSKSARVTLLNHGTEYSTTTVTAGAAATEGTVSANGAYAFTDVPVSVNGVATTFSASAVALNQDSTESTSYALSYADSDEAQMNPILSYLQDSFILPWTVTIGSADAAPTTVYVKVLFDTESVTSYTSYAENEGRTKNYSIISQQVNALRGTPCIVSGEGTEGKPYTASGSFPVWIYHPNSNDDDSQYKILLT
ncbi:MAG: hypothetical protein IKM73_10320, partial [Acidaminococcaceae bacterium]|nr:hypothetical protein [Acidaminococcaceae bacterium]